MYIINRKITFRRNQINRCVQFISNKTTSLPLLVFRFRLLAALLPVCCWKANNSVSSLHCSQFICLILCIRALQEKVSDFLICLIFFHDAMSLIFRAVSILLAPTTYNNSKTIDNDHYTFNLYLSIQSLYMC